MKQVRKSKDSLLYQYKEKLPCAARALVVTLGMLVLVCSNPSIGTPTKSQVDRGVLGLSTPINGAIESAGDITSAWSLPMVGPLGSILRADSKANAKQPKLQPKELKGGICLGDDHNAVGQRIDELLEVALDNNEKTKVLDATVAHYRTTTQKVIAQTKDATDYLIPYRGFGPSIEAGDIILDEKVKLKSRASAEYARQKHIDETHLKVVTNVMQLAMGLGMKDRARGNEIVSGAAGVLKDLVGEEEAQKTMQMLSSWSTGLSVPESVYKQEVWDVAQHQEKYKNVLQVALDNDQVIHGITKAIHKYNHRSKFARVSSQVVQTTLGAASLTPSFIGPAAKLALLTFIMSTGGPESCKLMKELYLDKRFESRWKVVSEEAHMALQNYQLALLTHNPLLLACSESLVEQMTGPEHVTQVFGESVFPKPGAAEVTTTSDVVAGKSSRVAPGDSSRAIGEGSVQPALVQSPHLVSQ